jgi:alginate O-acetyltransferase complex protein AlgI
MILFNSLTFLFRFFPVFLAIYYLTPARFREVVLFFGSIVFYAMGAGYMAIMLTVLTIANYILGQMVFYVDKGGVRPQNKRAFIAALILDVGALVVFKALSGITDKVVLPLGFSFYLFKMISYQADLFRGEITRRPEIMDTVVYFTMFPQVTQGPISRWNSIGFEKRDRTVTVKAFNDGLFFFVLGLGMKVLLADPLSILWNEIGKIGYESISTPLAWMGAIGYSLRLYMDFWGYSLMSAGIGMMLGYHFVINFLHPYWACGIGDFYRRWHATLGSWFRDYVYIPLGGNRKGNLRTILNLAVVWLLTGLWHGITPNFLIWSGVLFLLIVWEKFVVDGLISSFPIIGHLHVWLLIPLTWVIFAIPDLSDLRSYFMRLFPFFGNGVNVNSGDFMKQLTTYWPLLLISLLLCTPHWYRAIVRNRRRLPVLIALAVVFWICVYRIVISASNPFMYFSF